jgi:hypothetical protein
LKTFTACSKARRTADGNCRRGGSGGKDCNLRTGGAFTTSETFPFPFGLPRVASTFPPRVRLIARLAFGMTFAFLEENFLALTVFVVFFLATVFTDFGAAFLTLVDFFTGFADFVFALAVFFTNLFFAGFVRDIDFELVAFAATLLLPFDLVL